MNRLVMVRCPYCGKENFIDVQSDVGQMTPVNCDVMEGGCDKWFVAKIEVKIVGKALKIEGEDWQDAAD